MDDALVIRNLSKSYPGFDLRNVSFRLPRGYIMGLIGPNGAGKTTIIKLILNLVRREGGEIAVLGRDNIVDETWIKERIGFVHETPAFYGHLSVRRTASLVGRFYDAWDDGRFRRLAGEFGLPLDKKVGRFSRGTKMKLALALALSHDAEFLVLDEPTSGLDPVFRRELLATLSGLLQDGRTSVLFSTHITSDLDRPADFITFLLGGEVVFSCSRETLRDSWVLVKGGGDLLDERSRPLFRALRETPFGFQGLTSRGAEVRRLLGEKQAAYEKPSLDEIVFLMSRES